MKVLVSGINLVSLILCIRSRFLVRGESSFPSDIPSDLPSSVPSQVPSIFPSNFPSNAPSDIPSNTPSDIPSNTPSDIPSNVPSDSPSDNPSNLPSYIPSNIPSKTPTTLPSAMPSNTPSKIPSDFPLKSPSVSPSALPSIIPSISSAPTCFTLGNDWYLEFLQATTKNDENWDPEMILDYLAGASENSKTVKAKVLDGHCNKFSDNYAVYVKEINSIRTENKCTNQFSVKIAFNKNKSVIRSSPLWEGSSSTGCLYFCIRVEFLDGYGLSVSFEETTANICMNLDVKFTNLDMSNIAFLRSGKVGLDDD